MQKQQLYFNCSKLCVSDPKYDVVQKRFPHVWSFSDEHILFAPSFSHEHKFCVSVISLISVPSTTSASGIEPDELLLELRTCGLNIHSGETVELYKDEEFSEALMIAH